MGGVSRLPAFIFRAEIYFAFIRLLKERSYFRRPDRRAHFIIEVRQFVRHHEYLGLGEVSLRILDRDVG